MGKDYYYIDWRQFLLQDPLPILGNGFSCGKESLVAWVVIYNYR